MAWVVAATSLLVADQLPASSTARSAKWYDVPGERLITTNSSSDPAFRGVGCASTGVALAKLASVTGCNDQRRS